MRLRIKPDDAYIIQKLDCDGNWIDWYPGNDTSLEDLTAAMREQVTEEINLVHGMPDNRVLEANDCAEYDLVLPGNNQVLLPIHIDEGDLITVSNARGQSSLDIGVISSALGTYYPPIGATSSTLVFDHVAPSEFPLPGANKARLIMNIGGAWHDAYNVTDYEVPVGVVQDNLVFMINDDNLPDNMGYIYFHVKICKSSSLPWTKIWNFADNDGGWEVGPGGTYGATYNPDGYWETSAIGIFLNKTFPSTADLSYMKVVLETDGLDQSNNCSYEQFGVEERTIGGGSTQWFDYCNKYHTGIEQVVEISNFTIHEGKQLEIGAVNSNSSFVRIYRIEIHGTGPQPNWDA